MWLAFDSSIMGFFAMFVAFVSFLKIVICCDLFSHCKYSLSYLSLFVIFFFKALPTRTIV